MKKNLLVIVGIFLIIIAILIYFYYTTLKITILSQNSNKEYEPYTESNILGSTLMTVIHKATNHNEKNGIPKDAKNTYIENDANSIKIEIKFLESDKVFSMEAITSLGAEEFIKNYNTMTFQCTKKEYHKKTNRIKYMLFEQTNLTV